MNKAADIYWGKPRSSHQNAGNAVGQDVTVRTARPQWLRFVLIVFMTLLLCLTINYRAFTELRSEINENQDLKNQIQNLTDENLALQEEIHNLKNDTKTIERESRKLGIGRSNEKSLVPTN